MVYRNSGSDSAVSTLELGRLSLGIVLSTVELMLEFGFLSIVIYRGDSFLMVFGLPTYLLGSLPDAHPIFFVYSYSYT